MKKILTLSLILGTLAFAVPSAEAKSAVAASAAQIRVQIGQNRYNRRLYRGVRRVVISTRITRVNGYRYRETIRTTYLPNGRIRVQVISRTRLGRWRNY